MADAAHEIQTPLTALKGNLEVTFRKNRRASEYRETLIANLSAVERLMNLCRSLITLTRLAGADVQPVRQPVDLKSLLEEVDLKSLLEELVQELAVLAEDRGLQLRLEATPIRPIFGNPEQLQRVFINLLDNAIRHAYEGGQVVVRIMPEDDGVAVAVSDTGEGIAAEHLARIFDRFYRIDTARSRERGGVGLGLAIVKEIVDAHGAEIAVDSVVGSGSVFTIRFPPPTTIPVVSTEAP